jgi:hypothetical protein
VSVLHWCPDVSMIPPLDMETFTAQYEPGEWDFEGEDWFELDESDTESRKER